MQSTRTKNRIKKQLDKISLEATDCTVLHSSGYGDVEAWNLVTCYIQNAQMEGNDLLAQIECSLPYEPTDVQEYFRKLGIVF